MFSLSLHTSLLLGSLFCFTISNTTTLRSHYHLFFLRPSIISEHRDGDERLRSVGGAPDSAKSDVCFNPSLINPREREAAATPLCHHQRFGPVLSILIMTAYYMYGFVCIYHGIQVITNKSRRVIVVFRSDDRKLLLIYRGPDDINYCLQRKRFYWTVFDCRLNNSEN